MLSSSTRRVWDIAVTLILWSYYIMGYLVIFSPFYLYSFFFPPRREASFQKLNQRLHRLFFALVRVLIPGVKWRIFDEVSSIRSSIIIANHLSFLDPILFVSLYEKQKTIVKSDYFHYPVFGWILKTSGYMPSLADGLFTEDIMNQVKNMAGYLAEGGNLFIFPEGTRSRDGRIGPFDKGAFSIAKLCRAPIRVVSIRGTDKLYPPDGLWFHTGSCDAVEVELAGSIEPDYKSRAFSMPGLMAEARALLEGKKMARNERFSGKEKSG
jgi:1-acyl-sn-glycerol-3-phosphate acyltransferase